MNRLAIDAGPQESALVWYLSESKLVGPVGIYTNNQVLEYFMRQKPTEVAIEMIASYGMAVGASVFETVFWIGRFAQAALYYGWQVRRVYRADVKLHLCHSRRAKDANVRQAIMDRYGSTREKAIGTKKAPGPLYGVSSDMWAALAVAITDAETLPFQEVGG